ncbi:cupin domain-containing protein [Halococcus sp. IIIV-5B]|uniref:(R)-mandelonitrile lyase n=1 Tax=Halococcus sp. IIIV-5B TaxID=2321230 RepID=UPI000E7106FE|nr:cupin domain-containing protein [Halococcus sp. IIIV-5B]RJT07107.1 cupin domain-containing protein [Halococcus sp. IIIV-5B]
MEITHGASLPSYEGPSDYFTGDVRIDPLFNPQDEARAAAASVTFEPASRTAWHTHPIGQQLVITSGFGLVQREDGAIEEVRAGDVVWFPADEKHWHGARPEKAMTHIAIQEQQDGEAVTWLEQVTNEEYNPESNN